MGPPSIKSAIRKQAVYGHDYALQAPRKFRSVCQGHVPLAIPFIGKEVKGQGQDHQVSRRLGTKSAITKEPVRTTLKLVEMLPAQSAKLRTRTNNWSRRCNKIANG